MTINVQPLKKLRLQLTATDNAGTSQGAGPVPVEFIYGINADGLSPFEEQLAGKKEGDVLSLAVPGAGVHKFFGQSLAGLQQLLGLPILPVTIHLTVEILVVSDADNREVVQSLAKAVSHGGCGGGCDCGCS